MLTPAQERAAVALAQGKSHAAIAKQAKVCRNTLYAWRQLPEFADLVTTTRRQLWEEAISQAVGMVGDALQVTRSIANGEVVEAKVSDRLAACKLLLDVASKLDAVELEARIAALEAARESGRV
jgi:hypothetical protein